MKTKLYFYLLILLLLLPLAQLFAQTNEAEKDSLSYLKLEEYSKKRRSTSLLYQLVFVDSEPEKARKPETEQKQNHHFEQFEGKRIRTISINIHDPFEYNKRDNNINPSNFLMQTGNYLHLRTLRATIRNLLLFKPEQTFDNLRFTESERLVRSQGYLREVAFDAIVPADNPEVVDIYIRVWDNWTLIPQMDVSLSDIRLKLSENNFAGTGHRFSADTRWKRSEAKNKTRLSYIIPNIGNTYINGNMLYVFEGRKTLEKSIALNRALYSPLAKWAGGIYLGQNYTEQRGLVNDTVKKIETLIGRQDFWGAKSWKLLNGKTTDARTTNLILAARFEKLNYPDRSNEAIVADIFNNQQLFLTAVGVTSRKFVRDSYIFDYGKVEDVPVGRALGMTFGLEQRQSNRLYGSIKFSWANYTKVGYLSAGVEYGTYHASTGFEQGVIRFGLNYFTPVFEIGKWKMRQFVKPEFVVGIDRKASDILSFSASMKDFENFNYKGKHMMALTLQLQTYAPWNLIGFRFGPYLFTTFGMLGNDVNGFRYSRVFPVLGAGVLLKNDYLIISNFQFSVAFYPTLPGSGNNVFKTAAYQTTDFGFIDLELSKPLQVAY